MKKIKSRHKNTYTIHSERTLKKKKKNEGFLNTLNYGDDLIIKHHTPWDKTKQITGKKQGLKHSGIREHHTNKSIKGMDKINHLDSEIKFRIAYIKY